MARSLSDWERWLIEGQKGDQRAYRRFLDAISGHLARYFAHKAPPADAADLVQETLVALHRKRATYNPAYPLLPWLNTIARYKWIDWLRASKRAVHVELDEQQQGEDPGDPAAAHALSLLLEHLPPGQAEAIRLVKIGGLTIAEASAETGQSVSLVKVNIHRGIKKMAAIINDVDEENA